MRMGRVPRPRTACQALQPQALACSIRKFGLFAARRVAVAHGAEARRGEPRAS